MCQLLHIKEKNNAVSQLIILRILFVYIESTAEQNRSGVCVRKEDNLLLIRRKIESCLSFIGSLMLKMTQDISWR